MEEKGKTCGIILADRRVEGYEDTFRPLALIGGTSMIKRQIEVLRKAGISDIYIVTGFLRESVERHVSHRNVTCVFNDRFEEDSLIETIRTGTSQLPPGCVQAVVVPEEVSLFEASTVKALLDTPGDLVLPRCEGQEGWPAVMRPAMWRLLREADPKASFEKLRRDPSITCALAETEDKGTVLAFDSAEGYQAMQEYASERRNANSLTFACKIVLSKNEDFFGPGIARFLLAVEEKGSMLAACEEMGMSYSKGWKMVRTVEQEMGFPFLIRQTGGAGGGSSRLTEEGREFIRRYQALQSDIRRTTEAFFNLYFADFQ